MDSNPRGAAPTENAKRFQVPAREIEDFERVATLRSKGAESLTRHRDADRGQRELARIAEVKEAVRKIRRIFQAQNLG